jgi:SpoVK/Ycf46/Vps4 family AAA+-type ATPase
MTFKSRLTRDAWKDLALPAAQSATLRRLATEAGGSRSARALFVGESATARKAAEAVARHLGRTLFVVDLGAIVGKYVGDTEKQIGKVFDTAEANGSVLFLDEAEALFGKRTAVKDCHDRYANTTADTVLRRLESFGGLAIVVSRKKSGLNGRLLCALRSVVSF